MQTHIVDIYIYPNQTLFKYAMSQHALLPLNSKYIVRTSLAGCRSTIKTCDEVMYGELVVVVNDIYNRYITEMMMCMECSYIWKISCHICHITDESYDTNRQNTAEFVICVILLYGKVTHTNDTFNREFTCYI